MITPLARIGSLLSEVRELLEHDAKPESSIEKATEERLKLLKREGDRILK